MMVLFVYLSVVVSIEGNRGGGISLGGCRSGVGEVWVRVPLLINKIYLWVHQSLSVNTHMSIFPKSEIWKPMQDPL